MHTKDNPTSGSTQRSRILKSRLMTAGCAALALVSLAAPARAASILWVADTTPLGFSGAGGNNITDAGFVRLLESAGHTVARWNSPDANATRLSVADLATVNGYDLVILGRAGASGQHQFPQSVDWNAGITKPLICMSAYFPRFDGGRFGWFGPGNAVLPDTTPTPLTAGDPANAAVDYLFAGVDMVGNKTAENFDEMIDRNTTVMQTAPVAGGIAYSTASFAAEANAAATTAYTIVGFPAGTVVSTNTPLAAYRMFFAGGSREGAQFPNAIPLYTGRENLTQTGEDIFLRSVNLALNSGIPAATDPAAPIAFVTQPASVTVASGSAVRFTAAVVGAGARTLQWQRDSGDGVTFTNIPDAVTPFLRTRLTLPAVAAEDNGARFRVEATNPQGTVYSDVVTLNLLPDSAPPVPLSATTMDGAVITVQFDERLETLTAQDIFSYNLVDPGNAVVLLATLRPDGKSVDLTLDIPASPTFTLTVVNVADLNVNAIPEPGVELAGVNFGLIGASIGALNGGGGAGTVDATTFKVSGGGQDYRALTEEMRLAYKQASGNFDARIRVKSITATNRLESLAKAILNVRASTDGAAPSVSAFVTPAYPGDNTFGSVARATQGGVALSNILTTAYAPLTSSASYPNIWLRVKRLGNSFTTYSSGNGSDWSQLAAVSVAMTDPVLVGAGVNSHRNGQVADALFSNFEILPVVANSPTLINSAYSGGSFSASFQTEAGFVYRVQYKDDLNAPNWTDLGTITGDGSVKSITDAAGGNRFYRVITQ